MTVETRGIGIALTDAHRDAACRAVGFALRRHRRAVRGVSVRVVAAGGATTTCRVVATTRVGDTLVVEASDRDVYAAIGFAARRLDRVVARERSRARCVSRRAVPKSPATSALLARGAR